MLSATIEREEYQNYHSKPEAKRQRAENNKANRKKGTYGNGDGKDVAHKNNNTKDNSSKNLKLESPSKNRSFKRDGKARRK